MAWFAANCVDWEWVDSAPETWLARRIAETSCPLCGAPRGARCITKRGVKAKNPHAPRTRLWLNPAQKRDQSK